MDGWVEASLLSHTTSSGLLLGVLPFQEAHYDQLQRMPVQRLCPEAGGHTLPWAGSRWTTSSSDISPSLFSAQTLLHSPRGLLRGFLQCPGEALGAQHRCLRSHWWKQGAGEANWEGGLALLGQPELCFYYTIWLHPSSPKNSFERILLVEMSWKSQLYLNSVNAKGNLKCIPPSLCSPKQSALQLRTQPSPSSWGLPSCMCGPGAASFMLLRYHWWPLPTARPQQMHDTSTCSNPTSGREKGFCPQGGSAWGMHSLSHQEDPHLRGT